MNTDQFEFMDRTELKTLLRRVRDAAAEIQSQHGDDLCWMPSEVNRLLALLGLPEQDVSCLDKFAMAKNCFRYIDCLKSGGKWVSYAELERRLCKLWLASEIAIFIIQRYSEGRVATDEDRVSCQRVLARLQDALAEADPKLFSKPNC